MKQILFSRVAAILVLAVCTAGSSYVSVSLKNGGSEKKIQLVPVHVSEEMTLEDVSRTYTIDRNSLREVFGVDDSRLTQPVKNLNISDDALKNKIRKAQVLSAEHAAKNWIFIGLKFALWIIFLSYIFIQLRRRMLTPFKRKIFLGIGFVLFGIVLGSDPSPMGTVKDAIILFTTEHVIFPPRLIAFFVMLVFGTILANKILCSWGCQFGTLQDFIFRLGRDKKDLEGKLPQPKLPFFFTNSVRVIFFFSIIAAGLFLTVDIVAPIDPFTIFKPAKLLISGIIFISAILILSLFIYRPWCHLFCPFGLVGWIGETISIFKIRINRKTCISCGKCDKACPSSVMGAILHRRKCIPDCFSCGTCINACPTKSISFASGKHDAE